MQNQANVIVKRKRRSDSTIGTSFGARRAFSIVYRVGGTARRSKRDGSACGWLALELECDAKSEPVCVRVQSIGVAGLKLRLLGRLPYGRELTLNGKDATVVFKPGKKSQLRLVEDAATITLQDNHLAELVGMLQPHAGIYSIPGLKNVVLQVLRTEIKDRDGKVVDIVE